MTLLHPAPYLRQGLLSNATTNAGLALFLIVAAGALTPKLALPPALLLGAGLVLGAATLLLGSFALRETLSRRLVWGVILFNLA